ncbi:MAG: flagellar motor switch protein FliM [Cohaesibacteraceae bacterium]
MIADDDDWDEDGEDADDMAAQWAAMLDDEEEDEGDAQQKGADRVLNQDEIDNLLGFNAEQGHDGETSGVRAIINSALVSYERLPMLEIIFDRLVRLTTTSLRNFTSDNVEVSLDGITSVRFGDYLNSIPLPAILSVFKAEEWDNFGLVTIDSGLIYSVIDVLLGGRRSSSSMRVEGRPYTTIEMNLMRRMIEVLIGDAQAAFAPLSKVTFSVDRLETNPRFATIARPANAAILVEMRVDMEDRGGKVELLLPYATIEPIRELLLQMFMGEKFGRDSIWEGHLASEIYAANVNVDAVIYEEMMPLSKVMNFKEGQTLMFDTIPTDSILLKCGETILTEGQIGQRDRNMAVRVLKTLRRPKTTLESFEHAADQPNAMEP